MVGVESGSWSRIMTVAELNGRVAVLEATIARLQGELENLEQKLNDVRNVVDEREKESLALREQIRAERERSLLLKNELVDVQKRLQQSGPGEHDWLSVVGMFADDPEFEEIVRLGREYRQQQPIVGEE
jgi:hypothetical protein